MRISLQRTSVLIPLLACLAASGPIAAFSAAPAMQDPSDLAFASGLWRSEFLMKDKDKDEQPAEADNDQIADHASGSIAMPGEITQLHSHNTAIPLEEQLLDQQGIVVDVEPADSGLAEGGDNQASLSDWDRAETKAAGGVTVGATSTGPSVISMVVGVVGIMIVVGAYCSSSSRK